MDWIEPDRTAPAALSLDDLAGLIGRQIGQSRHLIVSQQMISDFGRLTGDEQYIHTDPDHARDGPFGGAIAHGFLTLALFSVLSFDGLPPIAQSVASVNYGFDRIRLISPVRAGAAVAARFTLLEVTPKGDDAVMLRLQAEVTAYQNDKPAVAAEWLVLHMFDRG